MVDSTACATFEGFRATIDPPSTRVDQRDAGAVDGHRSICAQNLSWDEPRRRPGTRCAHEPVRVEDGRPDLERDRPVGLDASTLARERHPPARGDRATPGGEVARRRLGEATNRRCPTRRRRGMPTRYSLDPPPTRRSPPSRDRVIHGETQRVFFGACRALHFHPIVGKCATEIRTTTHSARLEAPPFQTCSFFGF
jgi:hypothetical protein